VHVKTEKAAAWLGFVMIGVLLLTLVYLGEFIPPYDPSASAAETAARISENQLGIRIGMGLMVVLAFLFAPYFALLSLQVRRIEGHWGVLSVAQIQLSAIFPFVVAIMGIFAIAAAYRPNVNPDVTQALSDVFWLILVGFVGAFVTQVFIFAFAVFTDKRLVPSFPRWFGYFQIWYALFGALGAGCFVFRDGPLAWDGLIAFWIPLCAFGFWIVVTTVMLMKSVDVEAAERATHPTEQNWEPA
jgi:hypothetical protein